MGKVKLLISYDGTDFCGWQKQAEHAFAPELPSLQETVEKALQKILQHPISLCASGRTDAGVHAVGQVAHFETDREMPKDLCWALRSVLPASVVVKKAWLAPRDFHATLSAQKKTYKYWVWNADRPSPLFHRYAYWVRKPLNLERLKEATQVLLGEHDFASFRTKGTPVRHTIRSILEVQWRRPKPHFVEFSVTGSGFLKQMVRNIVGTALDMDLKGRDPSEMIHILQALDRQKAGPTAPPQGLFLYRVYYPLELDNKCRQI